MYSIIYFGQVLIDLQEAKTWYKLQKEGLKIEFTLFIKKPIE